MYSNLYSGKQRIYYSRKATCTPGSKEFITAGTFTFTVPKGCTSITATLVAGGAGGGAGSIYERSTLFTSTTTWSIPAFIRNTYAKLYAVGGGGGAPGNSNGIAMMHGTYGGFVNGALFVVPNLSDVIIYIGLGGAGGYGGPWTLDGGGGGGATYISTFRTNASLVAGGGGGGITGGGAGNPATPGGGAGTSNGGAIGKNGKPDINVPIKNIVFNNAAYGNPGVRSPNTFTSGGPGTQGAMKIMYKAQNKGGSGGAAGAVVPKQKISASGNLTIVVGAGGSGGTAGSGYNSAGIFSHSTNGSRGGQSMIKNSSGAILLQTSTAGGGGGIAAGSAVGAARISNGKNDTAISMSGFSTAGSSASPSTTGTAGGRTTIDGANYCSAGSGSSGTGGSATSYGGCGGGGGGSGYNGGKGAPGYVKIEWGNI